MLAFLKSHTLEGIIAKRSDSIYEPGQPSAPSPRGYPARAGRSTSLRKQMRLLNRKLDSRNNLVNERQRNRVSPIRTRQSDYLLRARVLLRIDIVELKGSFAVDLHDRFAASHGVVVHVRIEETKAAGR